MTGITREALQDVIQTARTIKDVMSLMLDANNALSASGQRGAAPGGRRSNAMGARRPWRCWTTTCKYLLTQGAARA